MKQDPIEDQKSFASRWAEWVISHRWPVLISSVLLALIMGYGGSFIAFDTDYRAFFSDDNPQLQAFDALQEKYTQDDNVFIVIAPKNGEVFEKSTLQAIAELTEEAWQTPFSSRVDALTNFQHTRAVGDDLFVTDLVEDPSAITAVDLAEIKRVALAEPLLVNRLVSEKGHVTAVNITVKLPGEAVTEPTEVIAHTRSMIERFENKYPELDTYTSGMVMLSGAFFEASERDMSSLIPLMFLVIVLVIYLTTRSISSTLAALMTIVFSIMIAMGFAGWMGIQLTPPSASAPTIILTLAIADSIHVLISMIQNMRNGMAKREAIIESVRLNFMPVFVTSVTTIIGFLSMNFSDVPPFHDLGNITSVGMAAAFLLSVSTLPALMSLLPVSVKQVVHDGTPTRTWMDRMADFIVTHNRRLMWATSIGILVITSLIFRNDLNDEFVEYFDDRISFRTHTDFISDNLTGIYNVEFSIGAGEKGGVNNPEYLSYLSEFEQWLTEQEEVVHVNSYVEVARRVNKSMHGDSAAHYRIPVTREEAAQYLLLYEMSLPFGLDLNNQINVDKSETRMTVTVENLSSTEMIAFSSRAENWLAENVPDYMKTLGTSSTLMFSHLSKRQILSMINGSVIALLLISFLLIFALRSVKFGAMSLIPNIAPIAVGFGAWALLSGVINVGMAVVFGMTLGIIVDDTVHFVSKYLRARRELGKTTEEAVRYAFSTVGRALIVTTVVLMAGVLILAQSSFLMNSAMAKITVLIITLALVIDFLLLPGIIILIDKTNLISLEKNHPAVEASLAYAHKKSISNK